MNSVRNAIPLATHAPPEAGILQQKLTDRLAEVLRRALAATGGNGAAIALMHKDVMLTCARAGCAPDLGSHVNLDSSFAGLCVRTGRTLRSDHLPSDPRANGAAWRALNVSSMVVTPVRNGDAVVGVLAVFAQKANAFAASHCVALEILALLLDTPPPPKRTPANHGLRPFQVRHTSQRERAAEQPPPPPRQAPAPETRLLCLPAAEPPAPTPKTSQPAEASSAPLKIAAVAAEASPNISSLPSAAATTKSVATTTTAERTAEQESAAEPPTPAPKAPQATASAPKLWPYASPAEALPVAPRLPSPAAATKKVEATHILRFHKSERMLHWSIAIPFLVCFTTAVILVVFYNPHPQRAYRAVFSLLHRISGACLMVLPAIAALRNRRDHRIHLYNIKEAFTWVADDVKWLLLMGAAAVSSKVSLPEQGKFNAAEKLNFIMVLCTYPLFIATGVVLWGLHVPVAAWMAHVGMAGMAAPLVLGHIFMATINPETRVGLSGMLTGYVDRHWARHHYTRWYRQHFEDSHARDKQHGETQPRRQAPLVQCPSEAP